jgi:hypothetical protein
MLSPDHPPCILDLLESGVEQCGLEVVRVAKCRTLVCQTGMARCQRHSFEQTGCMANRILVRGAVVLHRGG